ncbi:hypothetical protein AVEN_108448-1 [Araneus ventricosus]|uniref:Alcohol dehydrogenase-like N-terminal domain-containing protein n=1 Tax=Araneus ventricosus TaxID=182803 RepID=A0A4Y2JB39_ARAVE|nr:hypothetical protein AVEN_108448-1 [Araneus ventricosus]
MLQLENLIDPSVFRRFIQGFVTIKVHDEKVPIDPALIFQRMSITKSFEDEFQTLFEYELAPYPLSLFYAIGMRKTQKSAIYDCFQCVNVEIDNTNTTYIINGGYVGINASDVNITKGRYLPCSKPPFGIGLEAVGEIVEVGEGVEYLKVGQCIAYFDFRCKSYAEYTCIDAKGVFVIPEATPSYLGLIVSGLTATIGLDKVGIMLPGRDEMDGLEATYCGVDFVPQKSSGNEIFY